MPASFQSLKHWKCNTSTADTRTKMFKLKRRMKNNQQSASSGLKRACQEKSMLVCYKHTQKQKLLQLAPLPPPSPPQLAQASSLEAEPARKWIPSFLTSGSISYSKTTPHSACRIWNKLLTHYISSLEVWVKLSEKKEKKKYLECQIKKGQHAFWKVSVFPGQRSEKDRDIPCSQLMTKRLTCLSLAFGIFISYASFL